MYETAAGLTDLLQGAVLIGCALRLRAMPWVHCYWAYALATAGLGALAGALHHLVFAGSTRSQNLSWVAVGVLVATGISYLLAGTAVELLQPRLARIFIQVRIGGLIVYVIVISTLGVGRSLPLVLSESVTMFSIVALWTYAFHLGQPRAARMMVGMLSSAASAALLAVPSSVGTYIGMDGRSLQHLAQIPGVLLLYRATAMDLSGRADLAVSAAAAARRSRS